MVVGTGLDQGSATRLGRWLGRGVRIAFALLVLGGLLGAALTAARREPLTALGQDLGAGRVSEISFAETRVTQLHWGDEPTAHVRWKVIGSGWRVASLSDASVGAVLDPDLAGGGTGFQTGTATIGPDGVVVDPVDTTDGLGPIRQAIQRRAEAAGVPVAATVPEVPQLLLGLSTLAGVILVLVLIGGPQPRRATKWAWFWLLLVPGAVTQLAWLAIEAPWSERTNRRPEPLPHKDQPAARPVTRGRALLVSVLLGALLGALGWLVAGWLAT